MWARRRDRGGGQQEPVRGDGQRGHRVEQDAHGGGPAGPRVRVAAEGARRGAAVVHQHQVVHQPGDRGEQEHPARQPRRQWRAAPPGTYGRPCESTRDQDVRQDGEVDQRRWRVAGRQGDDRARDRCPARGRPQGRGPGAAGPGGVREHLCRPGAGEQRGPGRGHDSYRKRVGRPPRFVRPPSVKVTRVARLPAGRGSEPSLARRAYPAGREGGPPRICLPGVKTDRLARPAQAFGVSVSRVTSGGQAKRTGV